MLPKVPKIVDYNLRLSTQNQRKSAKSNGPNAFRKLMLRHRIGAKSKKMTVKSAEDPRMTDFVKLRRSAGQLGECQLRALSEIVRFACSDSV